MIDFLKNKNSLYNIWNLMIKNIIPGLPEIYMPQFSRHPLTNSI